MRSEPRDAEIAELAAKLKDITARCETAERRVQRYQIAFCQFQRLVADLCSADSYISAEAITAMAKVRAL